MFENKIYDKFWIEGNGQSFLKWANITESNIQSTTTLTYSMNIIIR